MIYNGRKGNINHKDYSESFKEPVKGTDMENDYMDIILLNIYI